VPTCVGTSVSKETVQKRPWSPKSTQTPPYSAKTTQQLRVRWTWTLSGWRQSALLALLAPSRFRKLVKLLQTKGMLLLTQTKNLYTISPTKQRLETRWKHLLKLFRTPQTPSTSRKLGPGRNTTERNAWCLHTAPKQSALFQLWITRLRQTIELRKANLILLQKEPNSHPNLEFKLQLAILTVIQATTNSWN